MRDHKLPAMAFKKEATGTRPLVLGQHRQASIVRVGSVDLVEQAQIEMDCVRSRDGHRGNRQLIVLQGRMDAGERLSHRESIVADERRSSARALRICSP
jgi:hypothetical protein